MILSTEKYLRFTYFSMKSYIVSNFSYFWSTSHPDASYQVSNPFAQECRRSRHLKQLLMPHAGQRTTDIDWSQQLTLSTWCSGVLIRGGIHIIIFLLFNKNLCCGYSLELAPRQGASNGYPRYMFYWVLRKVSVFSSWKTRNVSRQHSSPGIGVILECQGAL